MKDRMGFETKKNGNGRDEKERNSDTYSLVSVMLVSGASV